MHAAVIHEAGGEFELEEREIPTPDSNEVRIAVDACGICHSDEFVKAGTYPGISYPRIPGHEIAGRIDAVGDGVSQWSTDDRVGVGWHGGHCFTCEACRRGDFKMCDNVETTGVTYDGGYAEYVTVPAEAVAAIPDSLDAVDAAPLLCAGVTTFNALRNSDALPGELVAVQGVGGLGHLAIQYAHAAGFETAAISRSPDKEALAMELGADHFINATEPIPQNSSKHWVAQRLFSRQHRRATLSSPSLVALEPTALSSSSASLMSRCRSTPINWSAAVGRSLAGPPATPGTHKIHLSSVPSGRSHPR